MASFQLPTDAGYILKYPSTLGAPPYEKWMLFEAKAGRHIGRTGMNVAKEADRTLKAVALYLPPEALNSSISVEWQKDEYGAVYGAALEAAMQNGELPNPTTQNVDNKGTLQRILSAVGRGGEAAVVQTGMNFVRNLESNTLGFGGTDQVIASTIGQIPNPRTDLFFRGIDYRTHSFAFTMVPRNIQEARQIGHILNTFQFYMLPSFGKGAFIGYPYEFEITMFTQRNGGLHHLNSIGRSVLSKCGINHAAGTRVAFVNERGSNEYFPATTTIQLDFQEVRLLSRTDESSPIWHGTQGGRPLPNYPDPNTSFDGAKFIGEARQAFEEFSTTTVKNAAGEIVNITKNAAGQLVDSAGRLVDSLGNLISG